MARTEQEIYDALLTDKDAETDLTNLNSTSNTAIWRLMLWVVAKAIQLHEMLWDAFRADVDAVAAATVPNTIAWYKQTALDWQYGYQLTFINNIPAYAVDDPEARLIKRVAVVETNGGLQMKISKDNGGLGPLDTSVGNDELASFQGYMNQMKPAGTKIEYINLNGDYLRIFPNPDDGYIGTFYYDATVPVKTVKDDLDAKIDAYLKGLDYNGYVYKKHLDDVIQSVTGYVDMDFNNWQVKTAGGATWTDMGRRYQPLSGYMVLYLNISSYLNFVPDTNVSA